MPNFVWPPPFLPPPIPIQPPPVAMPDIHFFPIPHPGMPVLGTPVQLPIPIQTKVPMPTAGELPLPPVLAQQPRSTETSYQTVTFIPVGTLTEICYQKPDNPVVKVEETHSLVTNNLYGTLNTSEKPPATEPGKETEKVTPPPPHEAKEVSTPILPAPVQQNQGDWRHHHYHTHRYSVPPLRYGGHGREEVFDPDTVREKGHPEKKKVPEMVKVSANCDAHAEFNAQEEEAKTKHSSPQSKHPISEAPKRNDRHHHYYTPGRAYAFPFPIQTQPSSTPQMEQQATLQALAEMQDAIRNLQLAQAALASRVTEVDHEIQMPPPENQIPPPDARPEPEVETGSHIAAAECENANAGKPNPPTQVATSPIQSTKPTSLPGAVHLDEVPPETGKATLPGPQYPVSCPHGCPPFPHRHFGPQYHASHIQFPGGPPYQPGFNYSATYHEAAVNPPGYPYTYYPQVGSYPGIPMNLNYRGSRRPRRRQDYDEPGDLSSQGEDHHTRSSRRASVEESRFRDHHRGCPEPKSPPPKQGSKVPNLETSKSPKVAFSSNIKSSTLLASPSSTSSSSSNSGSEEAIYPQEATSKEKKRRRRFKNKSESESVTGIDTCHDKTTVVRSAVALTDTIRVGDAKLCAVHQCGLEEATTETTIPEQKGRCAAKPPVGRSPEGSETIIVENSERVRLLPPPGVSKSSTSSAFPCTTLPSSLKATAPSVPGIFLRRSGVAVETDFRAHITSISVSKVQEPTPTCEPIAHLSPPDHPPAPPSPPPAPSSPLSTLSKVTTAGLESDGYISGEESNTEELDTYQPETGGKGLAIPPSVPITQNKHKHKCGCQCCEKRREKRRGTVTEKKKKKRGRGNEKSSKRSHIDSDCHLCKVERVHGAGALFMTHEKLEQRTDSKGSILRDIAVGACAGGLGYLVGTMVNRKQTKKKKGKNVTNPFKRFGVGTGKTASEEVTRGLSQKPGLSDNDGVYKLSKAPPTPTPPEGFVLPVANAKPVYPGWNDEPLNINLMGGKGSSLPNQKPEPGGVTTSPVPTPPESHRQHRRHHHHHHHEYHGGKKRKGKASVYTVDLPKETLSGPASGENRKGNVGLVIHMKGGSEDWAALEKGKQEWAAAPLVANNSYVNGAFMRGALHDFTVDREAVFPLGVSVAVATHKSKKGPYPPTVYIGSDISGSPTPPIPRRQAQHYSDVTGSESPPLPTAIPPNTYPQPPHIQHPPAQPRPQKVNITPPHDSQERQSPCQPEHHYMHFKVPPPPAPHGLRRVYFQHSSAQQQRQHQQQIFELTANSDGTEWGESGGSGEEGGVELGTGVQMGVVDPPLRRRI